jgi:acetyl esterase/lipase
MMRKSGKPDLRYLGFTRDRVALAQALSAAASPYELHVMEGMPHGFMPMSALDGCGAAMGLLWDFLARNV